MSPSVLPTKFFTALIDSIWLFFRPLFNNKEYQNRYSYLQGIPCTYLSGTRHSFKHAYIPQIILYAVFTFDSTNVYFLWHFSKWCRRVPSRRRCLFWNILVQYKAKHKFEWNRNKHTHSLRIWIPMRYMDSNAIKQYSKFRPTFVFQTHKDIGVCLCVWCVLSGMLPVHLTSTAPQTLTANCTCDDKPSGL